MHHNRLHQSNRLNGFWNSPVAVASPAAVAMRPQFVFVASMLPQQAVFFSQVYRLAYERAVAELAPPRHFARYFSVWN